MKFAHDVILSNSHKIHTYINIKEGENFDQDFFRGGREQEVLGEYWASEHTLTLNHWM